MIIFRVATKHSKLHWSLFKDMIKIMKYCLWNLTCTYWIHWNLFLQNLKFPLFRNNEENQTQTRTWIRIASMRRYCKKAMFQVRISFLLIHRVRKFSERTYLDEHMKGKLLSHVWLFATTWTIHSPWNYPCQYTGW